MARLNAKNNAETVLAQAVSESDTEFVVEDAGALPDVPFRLSVEDEIVEVSAVDGNVLTVERAVEDTQSASYDVGTAVENRLTAGMWNEIVNYDEEYRKIELLNDFSGNIYYKKVRGIVFVHGNLLFPSEGLPKAPTVFGELPNGYMPDIEYPLNELVAIDLEGFLNIRIDSTGEMLTFRFDYREDYPGSSCVFNFSFPVKD